MITRASNMPGVSAATSMSSVRGTPAMALPTAPSLHVTLAHSARPVSTVDAPSAPADLPLWLLPVSAPITFDFFIIAYARYRQGAAFTPSSCSGTVAR